MLDPLKLGIFILFFIPGFIFVRIKDYFLREKKSEFEMTFGVILHSSWLWASSALIVIFINWVFRKYEINEIHLIYSIFDSFKTVGVTESRLENFINTIINNVGPSFLYYLYVTGWSLILAILWGRFRKRPITNKSIKKITGRTWLPSVLTSFFEDYLGELIEVHTSQNIFIGTLKTVPETIDDHYIEIGKPSELLKEEGKIIPLSLTKSIAIDLQKVVDIRGWEETKKLEAIRGIKKEISDERSEKKETSR